MNGSPHLPTNLRQWYGDSRAHWDSNTLVIDVTNFSPKTDFRGSRENLHLVERWTRTGPRSLEYVVTIEDPTVWTRPWTVKQEFTKQSEQETMPFHRCCWARARKTAPLPRDEVLIRPQETTPRISWVLKRIRCSKCRIKSKRRRSCAAASQDR